MMPRFRRHRRNTPARHLTDIPLPAEPASKFCASCRILVFRLTVAAGYAYLAGRGKVYRKSCLFGRHNLAEMLPDTWAAKVQRPAIAGSDCHRVAAKRGRRGVTRRLRSPVTALDLCMPNAAARDTVLLQPGNRHWRLTRCLHRITSEVPAAFSCTGLSGAGGRVFRQMRGRP
jgi:hypothetical protein